MQYFLILVSFFALIPSFSQNWTGAVNSDWNNNSNWSSPPSNGASVVIDPINYIGGSFSPTITTNSVFTVSNMIVSNGGVLTIGANLTTTDDVEILDVNSEIIMNQGVFNVNVTNGGRLIADLGGNITVNGGSVNVGERLISGSDAHITINNGNVSTNERLLMDLGGKIILQNGTLTVGQVMALADGDVNGSSYFEQNGGTITVTGEVALENEAGNFEPTIRVNAGTFNLNGDLIWFGAAQGSGTPRFITTGGVVNINGTLSNLPLSTVNLFLDINGSSQVNFDGASIDLVNATDSIKQSGNSTLKLAGIHAWNNAGVFYSTSGVVLCDGTTNLLGTGTYIFADLTVNPAKTLNHTSPFELFMNGDFSNFGTFNSGANKVVFNGNDLQTINGTTPINFGSLEINNSFGVTLNHPVSIADLFALTSGNLTTSSVNLLTMTATSSIASNSAQSFVSGPMKKIGNTPFIFPIGKSTNWNRLGVSAPTAISSELNAEYFIGQAANTGVFNSPLSAVSSLEYWQLVSSNPSDNLNLELFWENATQSAITECAATTIAQYNGTSWDNVNSTASGICSGTGNGSAISNTPQTSLGFFTFGYFGNVVSQSITVCNGESFIVGNNTYSSSGNYVDVLLDINNDDSTVITNLTVLPNLTNNQTIQICPGESYMIGNSTYTATGTYTDVLTSVNNCDSTVITSLIVLPELTTNQSVEICSGESYTIGTSTYTTTGTYTDILSTINGCDSTVVTNLSVATPIDVSTSINGIIITTNNTSASFYQWLDCDNGFAPIAGETSSTFVPSANGNYAVEITQGNCTSISSCQNVNSVALSEEMVLSKIAFYPNPSNGLFTIKMPTDAPFVKVELTDLMGNILMEEREMSNQNNEIDLSSFSNGVYIVTIGVENATKIVRLTKH